MEIQDYARALRKHVLLVVLCVAVGLGLAFLAISRSEKTYSSTQSILVSGSGPTSDLNTIAADRISSYLAVARSDVLDGRVASAIVGVVPSSETYSISASNPTGTSIIQIKATASTPRYAQRVASESVRQLVSLIRTIEQNASKGGQPVSTLVPIGTATLPTAPDTPSRGLILILGGGIGLFFGVAGALLRYGLDQSIRNIEDAEARLGVRVLGAVPRLRLTTASRPFVADDPGAAEAAEAFRKMVVRLRHRLEPGQHRILVTSSVRGEGASIVARNLASAVAAANVPTILITPDLQEDGSLGRHGPATEPSAAERTGPAAAAWLWHPSSGHDNLRVIVAPMDAEAADLETSDWVIDALTEISPPVSLSAAFVIVDCGGAIQSADAEIISGHCTEVLVVVESEQTQRSVIRRTLGVFDAVDAPVVGLVLNARHRRWWRRRARRQASTQTRALNTVPA